MPIQQTTPEEAYTLLRQGYRYIDVRTEPEFADGHPAFAVNIPVAVPDPRTRQMVINPEFLSVVEAHFAKDTKIILGCQSGGRSQRAAELLAQAGYAQVVNMQGGFGGLRDQTGRTVVPGWNECGLPICKDCSPNDTYATLRGRIG
jgi:rhodanese-related sulfurtransferase